MENLTFSQFMILIFGIAVPAIFLIILIKLILCIFAIQKNVQKMADYTLPIVSSLSKIQENLQKVLDLHGGK